MDCNNYESDSHKNMNELVRLNSRLKELARDLNEHDIRDTLGNKLEYVDTEIDIEIESLIIALENGRNELKDKFRTIKEELENFVCYDKINKFQDTVTKHLQSTHETEITHEVFEERKRIFEEGNAILSKFREKMINFQFESANNYSSINKEFIGRLYNEPKFLKCLKKVEYIPMASRLLGPITYNAAKKELLICDIQAHALRTFNFKSRNIGTFQSAFLEGPCCIGYDKNENLFVINGNAVVSVFDNQMNFLRNFKMIPHIFANMKIDVNGDDHLYVVHNKLNQVTVHETERGEIVSTIQVESPTYIEFSKDHVYVTSMAVIDMVSPQCNILRGINCIFVFNKISHQLERRVEHPELLSPKCIYLDRYSNLMTISFIASENKNLARNLYLFVFDKNGNLREKVEIPGLSAQSKYNNISFFDENKLAVSYNGAIKIIEFDYQIQSSK